MWQVHSTKWKITKNTKKKNKNKKQSLQMSLHLTQDLKRLAFKDSKAADAFHRLASPAGSLSTLNPNGKHIQRSREFCSGFPQLMPSAVASWQHGGEEEPPFPKSSQRSQMVRKLGHRVPYLPSSLGKSLASIPI